MTTGNLVSDDAAAEQIVRAAELLEAVARDCEQAVDFEVPLRAGRAAACLQSVLPGRRLAPPSLRDDADAVRAALGEAVTLLAALPPEQLIDPVLDALAQAQAGARALPAA
jgi:hypothetical protein